MYTAWRIGRGCSRMLERAKPDLIQQPSALSWWFQQRCSRLFVHQATNNLFQHAWTSLSTTMFNWAGQLNHCSSLLTDKNKRCVFTCVDIMGIITMLEAVVTLLWKHWTNLNSVENLIYYLKIITKLKEKVKISHSLKNVSIAFTTK